MRPDMMRTADAGALGSQESGQLEAVQAGHFVIRDQGIDFAGVIARDLQGMLAVFARRTL